MRKRESFGHVMPLGLMTIIFSLMLYIFWKEEFRFLLTPKQVYKQTILNPESLSQWGVKFDSKPLYFHFYDPNCRYSKANLDHINGLFEPYQESVDFFLVVLDKPDFDSSVDLLFERLGINSSTHIIYDPEAEFSQSLGVNAFPNALILDADGRRYFHGNYTLGMRFCGSSNIEQSAPFIALNFKCKGNPPPVFPNVSGYQCPVN